MTSCFDDKSYYHVVGLRPKTELTDKQRRLVEENGSHALDIIVMNSAVSCVEKRLGRRLNVQERQRLYQELQKEGLADPEEPTISCRSFEAAAEQMIDLLHVNSRGARAIRRSMGPLEPMSSGWVEWFYPRDKLFIGDANLREGWNGFDIAVLGDLCENGKHVSHYAERMRSVAPADCRGAIHGHIRRYLVERTTISLIDGRVRRDIIASDDGNDWFYITSDSPVRRVEYEEERSGRPLWQSPFNKRLQTSVGMWVTSDYDWKVDLALDGVGVSITTTPVGCREVFRLRDIPPGRKRRAALLHFVCAHMRRPSSVTAMDNDDKDALIAVREHLRGARSFHWNGLSCSVRPAPFDVRRLRAQIERK